MYKVYALSLCKIKKKKIYDIFLNKSFVYIGVKIN